MEVDRDGGQQEVWDVIVVGGGPAGTSAAYSAACNGARVLILEKAHFPRYKTCGGGIIGTSTAALPTDFRPPVMDEVREITFTLNGRLKRTRRVPTSAVPLFLLVERADFDNELASAATRAGAKLRTGCTVTGLRKVETAAGLVRLSCRDGSVFDARCVIGADGSASRISTFLGVHYDQVDLGLEAEIDVSSQFSRSWKGKIALDWGTIPGSYGWVFPKGNRLSVGVISSRENKNATRRYFERFIDRLGLSQFHTAVSSGHLTRCHSADSPLHDGRILVAGDAAGLLEPWTREGISFALRSGKLAGEYAVLIARQNTAEAVARQGSSYRSMILKLFDEEMQAGRMMLGLFENHPRLLHAAVTMLPWAWHRFTDFTRGRSSFADIVFRHAVARRSVPLLSHVVGRPGIASRTTSEHVEVSSIAEPAVAHRDESRPVSASDIGRIQ